MNARQALHLPLLLPLLVLAAVAIPAVLVCRVTFALLRYLEGIYRPRRYVYADDEIQRCTIPPDDHGDTCNGWPCMMVASKLKAAGEAIPGPPYGDTGSSEWT